MTTQSWFLYLSLVIVATSTPGPAVLFIINNAALLGWKKSVFAALGNIIGLLCLGIIAVTGLGALLKTSELVFSIVKYLGASYLIYLGIKLILKKETGSTSAGSQLTSGKISSSKVFAQALFVAISNPKAVVFLTALFPQFIIKNEALIPQFSILITVLMLFSFGFLMGYALAAHAARNWLTKSKRVRLFNRFSGSVFIGFGSLLAVSSNR